MGSLDADTHAERWADARRPAGLVTGRCSWQHCSGQRRLHGDRPRTKPAITARLVAPGTDSGGPAGVSFQDLEGRGELVITSASLAGLRPQQLVEVAGEGRARAAPASGGGGRCGQSRSASRHTQRRSSPARCPTGFVARAAVGSGAVSELQPSCSRPATPSRTGASSSTISTYRASRAADETPCSVETRPFLPCASTWRTVGGATPNWVRRRRGAGRPP